MLAPPFGPRGRHLDHHQFIRPPRGTGVRDAAAPAQAMPNLSVNAATAANPGQPESNRRPVAYHITELKAASRVRLQMVGLGHV